MYVEKNQGDLDRNTDVIRKTIENHGSRLQIR